MRLLIDADIIVYRGGFASEHTSYLLFPKGDEDRGCVASFRYMKEVKEWVTLWGHDKEDFTVEKKKIIQPLANALSNCKSILNRILEDVDNNSYTLFLSPTDGSNFREKVAVTHKYKANRKEKPHWYKEIRKYLIDTHGAIITTGQEADDALGIAQYLNLQAQKEWDKLYGG